MMQLAALKPPLTGLIPTQNRKTPTMRTLDRVMAKKRKHLNKTKRNRLVLEAKLDERFMLFDCVSGIYTRIKVFYRNNGNLAIAFEAPNRVRIQREKQWSVDRGDRKTN